MDFKYGNSEQEILINDEMLKFEKELKYYNMNFELEMFGRKDNDMFEFGCMKKDVVKTYDDFVGVKKRLLENGEYYGGIYRWRSDMYRVNDGKNMDIIIPQYSSSIRNVYVKLYLNDEVRKNIGWFVQNSFVLLRFMDDSNNFVVIQMDTLLMCYYLKNDGGEVGDKLKLSVLDFVGRDGKNNLFYGKGRELSCRARIYCDFRIIVEYEIEHCDMNVEKCAYKMFLNNLGGDNKKVPFVILWIKSFEMECVPEISGVVYNLDEEVLYVDNLIRFEVLGINFYIVSLCAEIECLDDVRKVVFDKKIFESCIDFGKYIDVDFRVQYNYVGVENDVYKNRYRVVGWQYYIDTVVF